MSSQKNNIPTLILLTILLSSSITSVICYGPHYIDITNELPGGSEFTIHCKSGDEDLKSHNVGARQKYEIKIQRPFPWTLYYCRVNWGHKTLIGDVFVRFRPGKSTGPCHYVVKFDKSGTRITAEYYLCKWSVTKDGLIEHPSGGTKPIRYHWS